MIDLKFDVPATAEVDVDPESAAAIDQGISDANEGRWVGLGEARRLVTEWVSRSGSQRPR